MRPRRAFAGTVWLCALVAGSQPATAAEHGAAAPRGSGGAGLERDVPDDGTSLVQVKSHRISRSQLAGSGEPELAIVAGEAESKAALEARADAMLESYSGSVEGGLWAHDIPRGLLNGCGQSTFHELGMSIPVWRWQHPGVDGFCHFSNYAFWFVGAGSVTDYKLYGQQGRALFTTASRALCGYLGENGGPERSQPFRGGAALTWAHLDSCLDAVDDPYCYSLGWLKGQRLDGLNFSDVASVRFKGRAECQRIQDTYHFIDEEVTVGRHIFTTPVYQRRSLDAILGRGPPVDHRTHNEHVYTKCLLGDALAEMAYCYYRGCVQPDGKIAHGSACGYDAGL